MQKKINTRHAQQTSASGSFIHFHSFNNLKTAKDFGMPLVALMLLNAPFWLLEQTFFVMRPVFSVDLFLAAIICIYSLRIGIPVLLFLWILDAVLIASFSYNFGTPAEFFFSAQFAGLLGLWHFLSPTLLGVLMLFMVFAALAVFALRMSQRPFSALLAWSLLICFLDLINGSTRLFGFGQDHFHVLKNVAGSPAWNLIDAKVRDLRQGTLPMVPTVQHSAFDSVNAWQATHPEGSILIVIIESLGIPKNPLLQAWLEQQLFLPDVKSRWMTSRNIERFSGSTTSGELRVLCGLSGHYSRLTPSIAVDCLPKRMLLKGYNTTGIHGFSSKMFDRAMWWPKIGLETRLFAEDLINLAHVCGDAFPGVCDKDLVIRAARQVDQPKQLVYLLTLNTHLPLVVLPIPKDLQLTCMAASISLSSCQLISQHAALLKNIAIALQNIERPPFVVIVGDHAPPFNVITDRLSFDQKNVPLYLLSPRTTVPGIAK